MKLDTKNGKSHSPEWFNIRLRILRKFFEKVFRRPCKMYLAFSNFDWKFSIFKRELRNLSRCCKFSLIFKILRTSPASDLGHCLRPSDTYPATPFRAIPLGPNLPTKNSCARYCLCMFYYHKKIRITLYISHQIWKTIVQLFGNLCKVYYFPKHLILICLWWNNTEMQFLKFSIQKCDCYWCLIKLSNRQIHCLHFLRILIANEYFTGIFWLKIWDCQWIFHDAEDFHNLVKKSVGNLLAVHSFWLED